MKNEKKLNVAGTCTTTVVQLLVQYTKAHGHIVTWSYWQLWTRLNSTLRPQ